LILRGWVRCGLVVGLGSVGRILMAAVSLDGGGGPWMACVLTCLLGSEEIRGIGMGSCAISSFRCSIELLSVLWYDCCQDSELADEL
jgi:hypothetical protein